MSEVSYVNKDCSYCGDEMKIAKSRVKRAVPEGAKDLELSDEIICWKCLNCEQSTTEWIGACYCGSIILSDGKEDNSWIGSSPALDAYTEDVPHFAVKILIKSSVDFGNYYKCTNCAKCYECGSLLKTIEYIEGEDYTWVVREFGLETGRISDINYCFFHKSCFDVREKKDIEKKRQQEEADKICAEKEFKQREQDKNQKERQRRIQNSLCLNCGSPLKFMDKLVNRQSHRKC